jgi:phage shock protein C
VGYAEDMASTLTRPRRGKIIAGVCAALSERFGLPKFLVRLGFLLFGLFGIGEIAYIALWIIIPKEPRA